MTLKPRTALTASPSQKKTKYVLKSPTSQSGKVTAKFATCARRNKKNTGNCLCSLRRHRITATTDCRIGCAHHKYRKTVWLCQVMGTCRGSRRATAETAAPQPFTTSSGRAPFWVNQLR